MSSGRTYEQTFEGSVRSPRELFALASRFQTLLLDLKPKARCWHEQVFLAGGGSLTGPNVLAQLTDAERDMKPIGFRIRWDAGVDVMFAMTHGSTIGYEVSVRGEDEVQVTGFGQVLKQRTMAVAQELSDTEPHELVASLDSIPGAQSQLTGLPAVGAVNGPQEVQTTGRSLVRRLLDNQWAATIGGGLVLAVILNLPAVSAAVGEAWSWVTAIPAVRSTINVIVPALVGAGLVTLWFKWSARRKGRH